MKNIRTAAIVLSLLAALGVGYTLNGSSTSALNAPSSATETTLQTPASSEQFVNTQNSSSAVNEWRTALSGIRLSSGSNDGNSSQNGSVVMSSSVNLHFCANGQFLYVEKSVSSVSLPGNFGGDFGGGFGDDEEQRIDGTWEVTSATNSSATLSLRASNGNQGSVQILVQNNQIVFDGQPMSVSRTEECG